MDDVPSRSLPSPSDFTTAIMVDDRKCKDFALPNSQCTWVSFNQLGDLVEQATNQDFPTYLEGELRSNTGCVDTKLQKSRTRARLTWGLPLDGGKHFEFGTPKFPSDMSNWEIKPQEAGYASYPVVIFKDADGDHEVHYKAAVQLLICPNHEVTGKASGYLMTVPDKKIVQQKTWCNGKLGFSALDAVFRKVVSIGRFQLVKVLTASTEPTCAASHWDGQTCLNSLMASDEAKCHVVRLSSICVLNAQSECVPFSWYNENLLWRSFEYKRGYPTLFFYSDNADVGKPTFPISFKQCMVGGTHDGQCSVKICASKFSFKVLTHPRKCPPGNCRFRIKFDGAISAAPGAQEYGIYHGVDRFTERNDGPPYEYAWGTFLPPTS